MNFIIKISIQRRDAVEFVDYYVDLFFGLFVCLFTCLFACLLIRSIV